MMQSNIYADPSNIDQFAFYQQHYYHTNNWVTFEDTFKKLSLHDFNDFAGNGRIH